MQLLPPAGAVPPQVLGAVLSPFAEFAEGLALDEGPAATAFVVDGSEGGGAALPQATRVTATAPAIQWDMLMATMVPEAELVGQSFPLDDE